MDVGGALDALKQAIMLYPIHQDMWDLAAHGAFLLRDHVTGRRLMKRTRLLGASSTDAKRKGKEYHMKR